MAGIALDTSAYSRLRSGHEGVLEELATASVVYVPTVVLGELHAGFRLGSRPKENETILAEFLAEAFVTVLPVTTDVSRRYGEMFASLRSAGTPIPVNDIWIAATAFVASTRLVTFDTDYTRIRELECSLLDA